MKSIDTWFQESIEHYKKLTEESEELKNSILSLPLEEMLQRCASIKKLQESYAEHDEKLHEIMAFIGAEVLDNPLIGKYQVTLDNAIKEADLIGAKVKHRKALLMKEIEPGIVAKQLPFFKFTTEKSDGSISCGEI